jgi:hypothetical protein
MAAESKLQTRVIKSLKRKGWLVPKIMLCSINGWPDVEAIKNGKTVRLELKAPGEPLEPLQEYVHAQIKIHGGEVHKIDSWAEYQKLNL